MLIALILALASAFAPGPADVGSSVSGGAPSTPTSVGSTLMSDEARHVMLMERLRYICANHREVERAFLLFTSRENGGGDEANLGEAGLRFVPIFDRKDSDEVLAEAGKAYPEPFWSTAFVRPLNSIVRTDGRTRKTDSHGSTPSASDATENRLASSNWKAGLKWFSSEFVVVVAGILVALGLQAWWKTREDSSRAAEYQQQILSDVCVTERTLRESVALDQTHYSATRLLGVALHATDTPTSDEAMQWLQLFTGWFADPNPVLGNVNALIQTGEIRLVTNPQIRAAIISYASFMETTWGLRETQTARMLRANDLALARLEAAGLPPLLATASKSGTFKSDELQEYLPAYIAGWPRLRSDEQFRTAQQWRLLAYSFIMKYNEEMRSATSDLRKLLEESTR